jgi:hypothetical protein
MIHLNYYEIRKLVEQRETELQRKARIQQLLKAGKAQDAAIGQRFFAVSGNILIRLGYRLKEKGNTMFETPIVLRPTYSRTFPTTD